MKFYLFLFAICICTCQSFAASQPDSIKVYITGEVGIDGHVVSNRSDIGDFTGKELAIATWTCQGAPCIVRVYMKFGLPAIPQGKKLAVAKLYLFAKTDALNGYTGMPTYGTDNASEIYRVTTAWTTNMTGPGQPANTNVNKVIMPQSTNHTQDYVSDITGIAKDWYDSTNYGLMIKQVQETTPYNSMIFHSSETTDSATRPYLLLVFEDVPNSVSEINMAGIKLYPNPTNSKTIVSGLRQGASLTLYNMVGQQVYTATVSVQDETIDMSALPNGHYILQANDPDGSRGIYKLEKQ